MKVGILLTESMSCNLDRSRYFFVTLTDLVETSATMYCKRADGDPKEFN